MRIYKMNGLGNAFAVFDARRRGTLALSPKQVQKLADPSKGIGCDQVIAIEPSIRGDAFMRIWNADGEEVSACGNAARCVAWLLMEETQQAVLKLETKAGVLSAERRARMEVCVDMGSPLLRWEEIPLSSRHDTREISICFGDVNEPILKDPGAVNMGNPHAVFFVDNLDAVPIARLGPIVENHPLFPQRVNVGFAQIYARDQIRLRVWERGAGLTKACGTGACAALVAAHRRNLTDRVALLSLDGGDLAVEWRESDDHVLMTGPVELEYAAALDAEIA